MINHRYNKRLALLVAMNLDPATLEDRIADRLCDGLSLRIHVEVTSATAYQVDGRRRRQTVWSVAPVVQQAVRIEEMNLGECAAPSKFLFVSRRRLLAGGIAGECAAVGGAGAACGDGSTMSNRTTAAAVMVAPRVDAKGALRLLGPAEFHTCARISGSGAAQHPPAADACWAFTPETLDVGRRVVHGFDLASEMVKSRLAQRQWCAARRPGGGAVGAVEMLSRSIAMELGFEMVSEDRLQMTV